VRGDGRFGPQLAHLSTTMHLRLFPREHTNLHITRDKLLANYSNNFQPWRQITLSIARTAPSKSPRSLRIPARLKRPDESFEINTLRRAQCSGGAVRHFCQQQFTQPWQADAKWRAHLAERLRKACAKLGIYHHTP
jgi:hypothetical protein